MSGLEGDMGLSSERTDGFEGVENTGTPGSAQGRTDGTEPTGEPAVADDEDGADDEDPTGTPTTEGPH